MGRLNDQRKEARKVVGIDSISGLPREEVISGYVVNAGIMDCVNEIAAEMKTFLERIPPQIAYTLPERGFISPEEVREFHILIIILRAIQDFPLTYRLSTKRRQSAVWRRSSVTVT